MKQMFKVLVVTGSLAAAPMALADDEGPAKSYGSNDYAQKVVQTVDGLIAWAKGELAEHDGEGLYEPRPEQRQLVQGMIDQAASLVAKAEAARKAGDDITAQVYYLSAESTARYAAAMPHMLEARLEE